MQDAHRETQEAVVMGLLNGEGEQEATSRFSVTFLINQIFTWLGK